MPLLFACNVMVGGALVLGWIYSIWQVHLLEPARRDLVLVAPPMLAGGELAAPPVHKPATRRAATALASQAVRKPAVHVQPPSSALAKNDRPSVEVAQPTDDTRLTMKLMLAAARVMAVVPVMARAVAMVMALVMALVMAPTV